MALDWKDDPDRFLAPLRLERARGRIREKVVKEAIDECQVTVLALNQLVASLTDMVHLLGTKNPDARLALETTIAHAEAVRLSVEKIGMHLEDPS